MTTFAETPGPLRRLFERLDFAPRPRQESLSRLLAHWEAQRGQALFPSPQQIDTDDPGVVGAFVYRVRPAERDYSLMSGAKVLEPLLGPCEPGSGLAEATNTRSAARLRRLFETVEQAGEPVLAEFTFQDKGRDTAVVDLLVAPLSVEGKGVDAILGGLAFREIAPHRSRPNTARLQRATSPLLFALGENSAFGHLVAGRLGIALARHEERSFEDGEHKARPLVGVGGSDVYVIDSLVGEQSQSPNDKLCRILFFIAALKQSGAARVTAVVPYLCYSRKDRQTKLRDPVTTRYVAQLFEAIGTDQIVTMEAHDLAAFQNAFRCRTVHLESAELFVPYFAARIGETPVSVVSPDLGGAKRAELFREGIEKVLGRAVAKGFMDKQRSMGRVTGELFAGDVDGRSVIVIDDLISTGTTMARVAAACRERGAARVSVAAAHGLFTGGAEAMWREPAIDEVVVTDTVPVTSLNEAARKRLVILQAADLFADAIKSLVGEAHHRQADP